MKTLITVIDMAAVVGAGLAGEALGGFWGGLAGMVAVAAYGLFNFRRGMMAGE